MQSPQAHKIELMLILTIFLIGSISAYGYEDISQGNIVNGKCINITQTCSNCTYLNITSITYPNSTKAISNVAMIKDYSEFNYNFCNTTINGQYFINYKGDEGGNTSIAKTWFFVTTNGKEAPSGIVVVSFSLMFIIVGAFLFYFIINTFLFFIDYNIADKESKPLFTLRDFLINVSGFLVLLIFYALERAYLGNEIMNRVLSLSIFICSWTNIFFPIIALVMSFIISSWKEVAGMGNFTSW
jgi:hypothetical protein